MNLIDRFIYFHRNLFPNFIMNLLSKFYLFFHKIKCFMFYGKTDMFDFITIELDRVCNRTCSYCPKSIYDDKENTIFFNEENFKTTIKQLSKIGYRGSILFSGYCEPLMNKNIKQYLSIARKNLPKAKLIIYTNGDFLDEKLMDFVKKNKVILIITIHNPIDSENRHGIDKIARSYKDAIIKKNIENYYLSTRGNIVNVKKKVKKKVCTRPFCELTVDYKGNVILCHNDFFSKNVYGNLAENNIIEIWNNKKFKKIRKSLTKKIPNDGLCKYCK